MKDYSIVEYGTMNDNQKKHAVSIFLEGFGHMMTFSKDEAGLEEMFLSTMHPQLMLGYVVEEKVLGIIGLASNKVRPVKFNRDVCVKLFGKMKGEIICKQMNVIFQQQAVKGERELYIDVLATAAEARGTGVATTMLNYAFALEEYDYI